MHVCLFVYIGLADLTASGITVSDFFPLVTDTYDIAEQTLTAYTDVEYKASIAFIDRSGQLARIAPNIRVVFSGLFSFTLLPGSPQSVPGYLEAEIQVDAVSNVTFVVQFGAAATWTMELQLEPGVTMNGGLFVVEAVKRTSVH